MSLKIEKQIEILKKFRKVEDENTRMKEEISKVVSKSKGLYGVYYEDDGCQQQQIFGFDLRSLIVEVHDVPIQESLKLDGIQLHWTEKDICYCGVKDCKLEDEEKKHFKRYTIVKSDTLGERNQKVMNLYNDKLDGIDYFAIIKIGYEHEIWRMFSDLFAGLKKFI